MNSASMMAQWEYEPFKDCILPLIAVYRMDKTIFNLHFALAGKSVAMMLAQSDLQTQMYAWHLVKKAAKTIRKLADLGIWLHDINVLNLYASFESKPDIANYNLEQEPLPRFLTAQWYAWN